MGVGPLYKQECRSNSTTFRFFLNIVLWHKIFLGYTKFNYNYARTHDINRNIVVDHFIHYTLCSTYFERERR